MAIRTRFAAFSAALVVAIAVPTTAGAAVTSTAVTSPANGTRTLADGTAGAAPTLLTISGTSDASAPTDTVDVGCWHQNADDDDFAIGGAPLAEDVATDDATGAWTVTVNLTNGVVGDTCLLRATAADVTSLPSLAAHSGPTTYFGYYVKSKVASGPNAGAVSAWEFGNGFASSRVYVASPYNCGLCVTVLRTGPNLRDSDNATTFDGAFWGATSEPQIKGYGGLTVDGAFVYTPDAIANKTFGVPTGAELPGFQGIDVTFTPSITGAFTITESMPLLKCNAGSDQPAPGMACTSFVSSGVTVSRTWTFDPSGREARLVNTFTSSDNAAHAVRAQVWSGVEGGGTFELPWVNSGAPFTSPADGAAVATPPSAPWAAVKHSLAAGTDGDPSHAFAGEVTSIVPSNINHSGDYSDYLLATIPVNVPAGGSALLERSSMVSATRADVTSFNARETDRMVKPTVAITAPTAGSLQNAAPVVVSGTATDNVGVTLTVNGVATPVTGGAFSTAITPAAGANTVTVVAKDAGGNEVTATTTFTFQQKTFTGTAKNDKLVGNAGDNVLDGLKGNDTIDCGAGGKDQANGGDGNDKITCVDALDSAKKSADVVNCGPGKKDVAVVDPFDKVIGCEFVTRVWIGGAKADKAKGTKANDKFDLKGGNDSATCGGGTDTVLAGAGNDVVNCVDKGKGAKKSKDVVNCGAGKKDKAIVDRFDKVVGCEKVTRV